LFAFTSNLIRFLFSFNEKQEIAENIERLDDFEDRLIRKGVTEAPDDAKM
jgi:hypothetical protein